MEAKKILFITQEIVPYVEDSEISLCGKQLPTSAQEKGKEVRIFMPKWGNVNERRNQLHEVIRLSGMNLIINDTDHPLIIKVASMQSSRMQVYFIDNDDYFMKRQMTTDEEGNEYEDNSERAIFYARGVLETVKKLRWCPDIIVCQGWIGSIVPFYIKTIYKEEPSYRDCKVIFMPHALELTKPMGTEFTESLNHKSLEPGVLDSVKKESYTYQDLIGIATKFSDGIIIGTPDLNPETKDTILQSGKKIMEYPEDPETFYERCNDFYDQVFNAE